MVATTLTKVCAPDTTNNKHFYDVSSFRVDVEHLENGQRTLLHQICIFTIFTLVSSIYDPPSPVTPDTDETKALCSPVNGSA